MAAQLRKSDVPVQVNFNKMAPFRKDNSLSVTLLYLSCGLLVVLYANLYTVYAFFNALFGSGFITVVPVLIPLILLGCLIAATAGSGRKGAVDIDWKWLLPGVALCTLALLVPDPRIGVKRIHVTEYLLLSLLVRYAMAHRLSGISLLFFSSLFSGILGIHDEFMQGLHPLRTYGLRDMAVNFLSGAGGSLIWHGLHFFSRTSQQAATTTRVSIAHFLYLFWLILSVLAIAVPMTGYLHHRIPLWLTLPLAASLVCWGCHLQYDDSPLHHGVTAVSVASFLLLLYPAAVNGFNIPFA